MIKIDKCLFKLIEICFMKSLKLNERIDALNFELYT